MGGFQSFNIEMMELTMELTIGEQVVETQRLQAPYEMLVAQCQQLVNQLAQDKRPMKVVFRGTKEVALPNEEYKQLPSRLIYANNAYTENFELNYE